MSRKHRHQHRHRHSRRETIPLDPEVASALEDQQEAFRQKFGRDPGPEDPLFFDPDADTPQELDLGEFDTAVIEAMLNANIDPAYIFAYKRTGLIVTSQNQHTLTDEDMKNWYEALAEYEEMMKGKPS